VSPNVQNVRANAATQTTIGISDDLGDHRIDTVGRTRQMARSNLTLSLRQLFIASDCQPLCHNLTIRQPIANEGDNMKTTVKLVVMAMVGMATITGCARAPLAVLPSAPSINHAAATLSATVRGTSGTEVPAQLFAAEVTIKLLSRLPNTDNGPAFAVETTPTSRFHGKFAITFDAKFANKPVPAAGDTLVAMIDYPKVIMSTKTIVDEGIPFQVLGWR
jgi:hypothetical protein